MRFYGTLYAVLLSLISLNAQEERFNHLTVNNGLAQNSATFILQDYQDFIWIGSYGGLNRYDGNKIKQYVSDVNNPTTLSSNAIKFLFEDSKKNLWVACYNGGLHKFVRDKDEFIHYPNTLDTLKIGNYLNVLSISEDASGLLWIGSEGGLSSFDPVTGKYLKHYFHFIPNNKNVNAREVFATFVDKQDNLWIGTRQQFGIFNKETAEFKNVLTINGFDTYKIAQDKNDKFWLSSFNNGVIEYDPKTGRQTHYTTKNNKGIALCSNNIESVFVDNQNQIWIGSRGEGISIIDQKNRGIRHLKYDPENIYSIGNDFIFSFLIDRSGVFWIGTQLGVSVIDLNKKKFHSISLTKAIRESATGTLVSSITKDHKGNFWFGTWGMGIFEYSHKTKKLTQYKNIPGNNNSISYNVIRGLCVDRNDNLWIGTDGGGINILDLSTRQVYRFSENLPDSYLPDFVFNTIYEDRKGDVWLGSWHGGLLKCKYSSQNHKISYQLFLPDPLDSQSLSHKTITQIFQDSFGTVWVTTKGGGINQIVGYDKSKNSLRFKHYKNKRGDISTISSDEVMVVLEDKNKNLWFGTNTGGISCLNRNNSKFTNFSNKDGLISNVISGMLADNQFNLWISTYKGLSRFNTVTHEIQNYDMDDGLLSEYFLENSFFKDDNGELYFGGENGVSYFFPDSIKNNKIVPKVIITDLQILNKPVRIGESFNGNVILTKAITETKEIKLTYKESVITIGFAALHYSASKKNKFAYRMTGFDKDWRFTTAERQFDTYTNLDPGEYLFEVKATNNDGFWSDKEATLRIFITPPFWFTWWAYFLYVSVLAALVYLYIRIRTNAQENELKALRKADKLKTEFLAQMSHEIRTPINVIMNFTSLVQEELESTFKEHFQEYFVNIKKAGSRVIRTIDLLLNMADVQTGTYEYVPREIHLKSDVIDNLVKEYSVFANEKKLKIEIVENGIIPTLFLDDYTVRQIFANLIDNAIKYTPKGNIKICLAIKGDEIAVSISDTGIGIKEAYIPYLFDPFTQEEQGYTRRFDGNGLGLALVKKYCDINNARIEVESQKDVGTTFTVYFQNSPRRN